MLKYIKWICLIAAIIGIIILSSLYIKNIDNSQKKQNNKNITETSYLYNTTWYKTKIENYENNKLIGSITFTDPRYIIFTKDYVEYVYPEETKQYMYTYNDKILTITGPTNFLPEGSYKVSLKDNQLKLSINDNNKTKVYYFTKAEG